MTTLTHLSSKDIVRNTVCEISGFDRYEIFISSGKPAKYAKLVLFAMYEKVCKMDNKELFREFTWRDPANIHAARVNIVRLLQNDSDFQQLYYAVELALKKNL